MVLTKTPICSFEEKAHNFNLKRVDNKFYKLEKEFGFAAVSRNFMVLLYLIPKREEALKISLVCW